MAAISTTDFTDADFWWAPGWASAHAPYAYYDDYYDYPAYVYDDSYYEDGACYLVPRRIHTRHGWRVRHVQVCG